MTTAFLFSLIEAHAKALDACPPRCTRSCKMYSVLVCASGFLVIGNYAVDMVLHSAPVFRHFSVVVYF